ncbi:hypothetical protein [Pseudorhodobacter ferrugineus]|uniref:hypothetical protein n=1 Tax=Pseudorhodobacter ferrugineus TaxID=77008 RepID=UPI0003B325CC|nr:hypothetical protein [Pseudorhodobacter ferrugineus]
MSRIIGLAIRLCGLVLAGGASGLVGFGMGGPVGAVLLFAIGGFIGFFAAPMVWRFVASNKGQ